MILNSDQEFKSRIFIINGAILLLFAVLITISNGVLLFMIYKDPLKTFRNATAVLVISLGFADLLTGCVTAVDVGISHILEGLAIQKVLLQAKIISQITVRAGVFIITMFAVERFIAVVFPYFYRFSVTVRKVTLGCVSCWLLAIISSCLELVVDRDVYDVIFLYITFVVPLLTVCVTYCTTYWVLKDKTKRLHRVHSANKTTKKEGRVSKKSEKLQIELMKTAMLIIFVFVLSLVPFWSLTVIGRYCKSCKQEKWYIACYRFSIPILYSNSAFNPILYAWRMQPYRRSFQAIFGRRQVSPRNSSFADNTQRNETYVKVSHAGDESKL